LGAAVFWLAPLLRGGLLRRDVRALCRNGGGLFGGGGFCGRHGDVGPFCARSAHDDSSLRSRPQAS
jgi:hypothetical protein